MSTPLQNLTQSLSAPRSGLSDALHGVQAPGTTEALNSDSQAFARWMAQHREAQQGPLSSMLTKAGGAVQTGAASLPGHEGRLSAAGVQARVLNQTASALTQGGQVAQPAPPSQAGGIDKTKTASKPAQAKPAAKPQGQAHEASRSARREPSAGAEADEAREVKFKTAQGEASAWVQELQPPADVPTSDPAAMLAWLASLTHNEGTAAAMQADGVASQGSLDEAAAQMGSGTGGQVGQGHGTGHAALIEASQMAGQQADQRQLMQAAQLDEAALVDTPDATSGNRAQDSTGLDFASLLARETPRAAAALPGTEGAAHHSATLATPVDSPDFAQALADRVKLWIGGSAAQGPMTAELRLNPAEMGPVHIRIELNGNQALVDFSAAQAETRQAIEASLPLLSGSLEEAGLSLAGGGVSDQNARQAWAGADAQGAFADGRGARQGAWAQPANEAETAVLPPQPTARNPAGPSRGLAGGLDLYA